MWLSGIGVKNCNWALWVQPIRIKPFISFLPAGHFLPNYSKLHTIDDSPNVWSKGGLPSYRLKSYTWKTYDPFWGRKNNNLAHTTCRHIHSLLSVVFAITRRLKLFLNGFLWPGTSYQNSSLLANFLTLDLTGQRRVGTKSPHVPPGKHPCPNRRLMKDSVSFVPSGRAGIKNGDRTSK